MKKFLAMLVAAMMVLSLVAIPVLADGEVVFAVENAPATATPGDEITVNLTVNGTFEAHVLNMQFNYNADAFEYVSHTRGDVLNQIIDLGGTQLVDATTIPGSMRLGVMMPTAAFTQSGTICSVTLRVKEGAANGASDLALVITEFKNFPTGGQATPIANVVNNATVTITGGSEPTPVPPTDEPITDEPITDEPITDEPITDEPITDEPITDAPITDEPVTPAPGDVIFSVGGVHYVAAGSQVSVDLTINGEYEANGMNIWVQYDAEKLTLNSVDEGEIMKAIKDLGGMNILDFQSIPGSVRLGSMLPTDPVSGSGKIFTMNFTVAEGLEDGTEMPIEILVKEFFNMPVGGENTPIAFFAENGSIVVGSEPIVTDEPGVTDEPTAVPTDAPNPPITGAMSLIGVGIAAIVASAGVVIFRKKEED